MCYQRPLLRTVVSAALLFGLSCRLLAGPAFVTSTFESGTDGWQPWGTSDVDGLAPGGRYLRIEADGISVFGKMITFNSEPAWTGDYYAAGVDGIRLDIANFSDSDTVHLRVALGNRASPQQSGGTWWLSKTAVVVPVESPWRRVVLPLGEADLMVVANLSGESGTDSYAETLSDIVNIRILSALIPLGAIGDEFVGDVGVDNIALIPEPSVVLLMALAAAILLRCRPRLGGA